MSSGLISATPSVPGWSDIMLPEPPRFMLYIGTPSMTYSARLDLVMDLTPRITTLEPEPEPDAPALMVTPATFPLREFTKLASFTAVSLLPSTAWTL